MWNCEPRVAAVEKSFQGDKVEFIIYRIREILWYLFFYDKQNIKINAKIEYIYKNKIQTRWAINERFNAKSY